MRRTLSPRLPLASALAAILLIPMETVRAGIVSGPNARHTLAPGDPREDWFVENRGVLTIAAGGAARSLSARNGSVFGNGVDIGDSALALLVAWRPGKGDARMELSGGRITLSSPSAEVGRVEGTDALMVLNDLQIRSAGGGISVDGGHLRINGSTLDTAGDAVRVSGRGDVSIVGSALHAHGGAADTPAFGLRMQDDSAAWISHSSLQGRDGGIDMHGGVLDVLNSDVGSAGIGLRVHAAPAAPAQVNLDASTVTGASGAAISGNTTLQLYQSRLLGLGLAPDQGAGLHMSGGRMQARNSQIRGVQHAIAIEGAAAGLSRASVFDTALIAERGPVIRVEGGARAGIVIGRGSTAQAGNGVLLDVGRDGSASEVDLHVNAAQLAGDIVVGAQARADIELTSQAALTGAIIGGGSLQMQASRWQMTADSSLQTLHLGAGAQVSLGDGSRFNALRVANDLHADGGTLWFNSTLGGDHSATDHLLVAGNSSGQAFVVVNNIGGGGAPTKQGIELIRVEGESAAHFDLQGRAVAGSHEYFLRKDPANGYWYLRSQFDGPADPCAGTASLRDCEDERPVDPPIDPPIDPPRPEPVLRPEGGAYLANRMAAQHLFRLGYHQRLAGQRDGRGWTRVDGSHNRFGADGQQLAVRGSSHAVTAGSDLLQVRDGVFGVMLASGSASSHSLNPLTGYHARGRVRGAALGVYGGWHWNPADAATGTHVDVALQRAQFHNRVDGLALASERYSTTTWHGSVEAGRAFALGARREGGVVLEPQLRLDYLRAQRLGHVESNGTRVTAADGDGLSARLGLRLSTVVGTENRLRPYVAAHWRHARAAPQIHMDAAQVNARVPRNRAEVSGGASLALGNGVGVWGDLSLQRAGDFRHGQLQLGVRYSW